VNSLTHVAIILDGNRRWAKENGLTSLEGHQAGFERIRSLSKYIFKKGIKYLSIFAFSTENFKRSKVEVKYLMDLFVRCFKKYAKELNKENIKLVFSGRTDNLRKDVVKMINSTTDLTKNNTSGVVNVCLNYGGHAEIVDATKKILNDYKFGSLNIDDINEELFSKYLYQDLPPIDLLIRTGGDFRISNFMLWNLAYSEIYITDTKFPDFDELCFDKAIENFGNRERRFGGDSSEKKSN